MKVTVKKLWNGSVSVRDYVIKDCHKKGEDLVINYKGKVMTVPHGMILFGRKNNMKVLSKFKDVVYDLVDYSWIPDMPKEEIATQQQLL